MKVGKNENAFSLPTIKNLGILIYFSSKSGEFGSFVPHEKSFV